MKIYLVIQEDRHIDPQIWAFSTQREALEYARKLADKYTNLEEWDEIDPDREMLGRQELPNETNWIYLYNYSTESDHIRVEVVLVDKEDA